MTHHSDTRTPRTRRQARALPWFTTMLLVSALTACSPSAPETEKAAGPEALAGGRVAELLGIAASEVSIISVEPVEFSDSSLDCPEPGTSYMQVITPGYMVVAEGDGRRFDVRVSGQFAKICHRRAGNRPAPAPRGDSALR